MVLGLPSSLIGNSNMMSFMYIIALIALINVVFPGLMTALSVPLKDYLTFQVWFNILIILYFVLPDRVGKMFDY